MVAVINDGPSLFGAISYNHDKLLEEKASIICSNKIIKNIGGDTDYSFDKILKSFELYLVQNTRTSKPVLHISINPSPEDNVSDTQFSEIAQEYLERMGYGNQPYIIYKHEDIDRHHIHIVTLRTKENGNKINDSFEKERSTLICRDLEVKYGLRQLGNDNEEIEKIYLKKLDYSQGEIKRQVSNIAKSIIKDYKFQSLGEYNALLSCYNIECKFLKGAVNGKPYNGIVYIPLDETGNPVSKPIKSSLISKSVGYGELNKLIDKNKKKIKEQSIAYPQKDIISGLMKIAKSKEEFKSLMRKKQMDVIFRINDTGRIYGVTFIDFKNKIAFNGSRIGKEFSANVFNNIFNNNLKPAISDSNKSEKVDFESMNFLKDSHSTPFSLLDDFLYMFYPQKHYDDIIYPKKKRKKKKRKKRL